MSEKTNEELLQEIETTNTRLVRAQVGLTNYSRKLDEIRQIVQDLYDSEELNTDNDNVIELLRILDIAAEVEKTYTFNACVTISGKFDIINLPEESDFSIEYVEVDGSSFSTDFCEITDLEEN
jgi:hypothetical protein